MQSNLEKFENTFLYLPFLVTFHTTRRVPPPKLVSREQKFGNIGEMAVLDHVVPRVLSLPPKERIMGTMLGVDG